MLLGLCRRWTRDGTETSSCEGGGWRDRGGGGGGIHFRWCKERGEKQILEIEQGGDEGGQHGVAGQGQPSARGGYCFHGDVVVGSVEDGVCSGLSSACTTRWLWRWCRGGGGERGSRVTYPTRPQMGSVPAKHAVTISRGAMQGGDAGGRTTDTRAGHLGKIAAACKTS
jgi:hypothetical protein